MLNLNQKIERATHLIQEANNVVVLTGAGISTPSGIPDFRSVDSGLWREVNPMDVASIMAFRYRPADFYDWVRPLVKKIVEATPNPAHYALSQLEQIGKVKAIITQNIDGLHQAAGSQTVFEVHGHIREVTCLRCYKIQPTAPLLDALLSNGDIDVPTCECGGILKPNVILFGEQLPVQTLFKAKAMAKEADLMIVVGSSLEVAPVSHLPAEAAERGTKIIIINYGETYMDDEADVVIRENVITILPQVVALMPQ